MKALVKTKAGYDNMELMQLSEPQAHGDMVKIKVAYAGICGTDLHTFDGVYEGNRPPVVLGHEFSGIVASVGESVTRFKVGDQVTSETTLETCGKCVHCREREYNLCPSRKGLGTVADGGFAEFVLSREESVHQLPEGVSLLAAAVTEPFACCVHGVLERTDIHRGQVGVVFGPGAIGLLTCQLLLAHGVTTVLAGVTKDESRFELARSLGVQHIVNQQKQDLHSYVMDLTAGLGADRVFECSGVVAALNAGLQLAARKADVVQLGVFSEDMNLINTGVFFPREIRMIGSRTQKPSSWEKALQLMGSGAVNTEKIITGILPLEQWREGFQRLRDCTDVKIVFQL